MIKAPTRTAWACLDVIPKHSTSIYLLFSSIFTCFHDIETNRWDRSVQPCPYNFWPVYELSLIGTSQLLPFTFSHTPIAQEKVFVGDRIIEVNGISKACSCTLAGKTVKRPLRLFSGALSSIEMLCSSCMYRKSSQRPCFLKESSISWNASNKAFPNHKQIERCYRCYVRES